MNNYFCNRRTFLSGALAVSCWPGTLSASNNRPPVFRGQARQFVEYSAPVKPPPATFFGPRGLVCSLEKWRGKVVLLSFWATWCKPCIWEMPHLDQLQATLGGADFDVVPVAFDEQGLGALPKAQAFFERINIKNLPLLFDHGQELYKGFGAINRIAMPISYVVDRSGMLRGYLTGPAERHSAEAIRLIEYYIAES